MAHTLPNGLLRARTLRALLLILIAAGQSAWAQQAPGSQSQQTPPVYQAEQAQPETKKDGPERWEKEIAAFEKSDAEHPAKKGGILFIGSSSIRMWKTLAQDFPNHDVLNRGFGGSEISDAVHFSDRLVLPYAPRMIVFYAGGNDIHAKKSPEQVAADFRRFTENVRAKLPEVQIAYISIAGNPARWAEVENVKTANRLIAQFCQSTPHMLFINVFPHMLGPDGLPKPEIFLSDRLHMNAEGYKLWTSLVAPHLGVTDRTSNLTEGSSAPRQ